MAEFRAARLRELQSQAVEASRPQYKTVDTVGSQADLLAEVSLRERSRRFLMLYTCILFYGNILFSLESVDNSFLPPIIT